MKKYILMALASFCFVGRLSAATTITGFGSSDINPFNTSTDFTGWTGTQTTTSVTVTNVSNQTGGIFQTLGSPINISGSTAQLQLTGSLTGTAPAGDVFRIRLFDSSFNSLTYFFNWSAFVGGPQTIAVALNSSSGSFNGIVSSWDLGLSGPPGDTVSFTFDNLAAGAVPEPSAVVLMVLGAGFLFIAARRRKLCQA